MSDNKMYDILGKFNNLDPKLEPVKETAKEPVYENVEPRGDIMEAVKSLEEKYMGFKKTVAAVKKGGSAEDPEAVAAAIGRKKYGKEKFQKAAAAGKKLGEAAKPDYIDLDKDGDKKEPMKKAAKDAKKVEESGGPYELYNPKHPKFAANYKKFKAKNPDCKLEDFIAAMKKKEHGVNEGVLDQVRSGTLGQSTSHKNFDPKTGKPLHGDSYANAANAMRKAQFGEGEYDPAPVDPEAVAKRKRLQALKDKAEDEKEFGAEKNTPIRKIAGKAYGGAAQHDAPEADDLDEGYRWDDLAAAAKHERAITTRNPEHYKSAVAAHDKANLSHTKEFEKHAGDYIGSYAQQQGWPATGKAGEHQRRAEYHKNMADIYRNRNEVEEVAPPGAKAERMVKHIKKGYAKDGKLTKREKGIAYATAWKAHNKGQLQESRMIQEGDYFYEKLGKALAEKNPTLNTADSSFVTAVRQEMVAQGIEPNRARNIIMTDEDFISDVATSYGHYCKEIAECGAPMNSFVDGTVDQELDEIARLAGLPVEETEVYNEVNVEESPDTMDLEEEEMGEGNEFSGALAQARASGAKEFEVDGKKYTVKEGVNTTITVNSDGTDAVMLIKQLAGIEPMPDQPAEVPAQGQAPLEAPQPTDNTVPVEQPQAGLEEEREIEHLNTPREKVAPADAAYPSGTDMHRAKKSYSDKPYRGDNPMAVKEAEDSLWKKYSGMLKSMILK